MEYAAIRHFADKRYCYAVERGCFLIRLETKKGDVARVVLHTQDKYLPLKMMDTRQKQEMALACSDNYIDYFECVVTIDLVCLRYFFEIEDTAGQITYYGNHDFYDECITDIEKMYDCPQNLREEELFELPAWAENKVLYQIFPSRFATDKQVSNEEWYQAPIGHKADLKGSLRGIINHLDYLKKLGVDILYMTPIFCSNSSHKYNIDDYYKIDPSFGDKADLKELVDRAHKLGMYVILDGVFNHTAVDFFAFRDIMENKEKSAYLDWYYIKEFPLVMEWGKKPNYKTFSYAGLMPKLNLQNKETADFVIDVASYWIRECDIDGWRLDVADEISHTFWKRFRREIKAVKRDVLIVGEIWHFAGDFLEGDEWDSVMNYQFARSVMDLVATQQMPVSAFVGNLNFMKGNLHRRLEGYLWNFIDTHDTERFLNSVHKDLKKADAGSFLAAFAARNADDLLRRRGGTRGRTGPGLQARNALGGNEAESVFAAILSNAASDSARVSSADRRNCPRAVYRRRQGHLLLQEAPERPADHRDFPHENRGTNAAGARGQAKSCGRSAVSRNTWRL